MSAARFWVKICGLTRPEDAALAARLGADLVGINFWRGSPRHVADPAEARAIADAARAGALRRDAVKIVGVFVNEEPARVERIVEAAGLDLVQFHGDEPGEQVGRFGARALRALRAVAQPVPPEPPGRGGTPRSGLGRGRPALVWRSFEAERCCFAWILDGPAGARYGGTGEAWSWEDARRLVATSRSPVLIAGGIRPGRARAALAASGAAGVDVASGVESSPGVKDAERMRRLIEEVRGGLD